MVLAAHGLTPPNTALPRWSSRPSTAEIVATLHISTHTLQDHLRAVFERFGVGIRRELVAKLTA